MFPSRLLSKKNASNLILCSSGKRWSRFPNAPETNSVLVKILSSLSSTDWNVYGSCTRMVKEIGQDKIYLRYSVAKTQGDSIFDGIHCPSRTAQEWRHLLKTIYGPNVSLCISMRSHSEKFVRGMYYCNACCITPWGYAKNFGRRWGYGYTPGELNTRKKFLMRIYAQAAPGQKQKS